MTFDEKKVDALLKELIDRSRFWQCDIAKADAANIVHEIRSTIAVRLLTTSREGSFANKPTAQWTAKEFFYYYKHLSKERFPNYVVPTPNGVKKNFLLSIAEDGVNALGKYLPATINRLIVYKRFVEWLFEPGAVRDAPTPFALTNAKLIASFAAKFASQLESGLNVDDSSYGAGNWNNL